MARAVGVNTRVELEWGETGAEKLAQRCELVVVVDVLSFTTTVSVAASRNVLVYPHRSRAEIAAADRASEIGAILAGPRGSTMSLSPATMLDVTPGSSVLLPSPNGATCALAAAESGAVVAVASLRNALAVAAWMTDHFPAKAVGFAVCGERWPDGSLRPAYEDLVGAGAVIARLPREWTFTPEAEAAMLAAAARRPLSGVRSGRELIDKGYTDDVAMAEEVNVDKVVPALVHGAFQVAARID